MLRSGPPTAFNLNNNSFDNNNQINSPMIIDSPDNSQLNGDLRRNNNARGEEAVQQ